jgi:hypothetical protein
VEPRAVLRPVGPEPSGVYWRRRALLLAVVVLVVVVTAWACAGGSGDAGDGRPAARATTTPTASSRPAPSATTTTSATPAAVVPCQRADLQVTASTDATTYPAGVLPRLQASLSNVGDHPCRFNAAPSARNWTILSGSDQVWSTTDCPPSHLAATALLRRARPMTYSVTWSRHRSTTGCATAGPAAQPGTYRLYVTIDRITSAAAVFRLG